MGIWSLTLERLERLKKQLDAKKAEIDELGGIPPDYETLRNMQYLKCVINEGLYPICVPKVQAL